MFRPDSWRAIATTWPIQTKKDLRDLCRYYDLVGDLCHNPKLSEAGSDVPSEYLFTVDFSLESFTKQEDCYLSEVAFQGKPSANNHRRQVWRYQSIAFCILDAAIQIGRLNSVSNYDHCQARLQVVHRLFAKWNTSGRVCEPANTCTHAHTPSADHKILRENNGKSFHLSI